MDNMNNYYHKYLEYKKLYLNLQYAGTNNYDINVQDPWFSFICKGIKTVEGRLDKGIFNKLQVGDHITFTNNTKTCKAKIIRITKYDSFKSYLETEGLDKTLPFVKTIDEGVDVYRQFYDRVKEKEFGILAIEIELL